MTNVKSKRKFLTVEEDRIIKESYLSGLGCKKIMKLGFTLGEVNSSLKRQCVTKRKESDYRKYEINDLYFEKINSPEKAYFLGWFYSDGYNQETNGSSSITLHKKDKYILEILGSFIYRKGFQLTKRKTGPGLFIHSRKISQDLAKLGCFQNKSLTVKFPTENEVPHEYMSHFIRGYFDGDGCVHVGEKSHYFSFTGSRDFIKGLNE